MRINEPDRAGTRHSAAAKQEPSDYQIARKISMDPLNVTRSRKNAHKKLIKATIDLEWASKIGIAISEFSGLVSSYWFYL